MLHETLDGLPRDALARSNVAGSGLVDAGSAPTDSRADETSPPRAGRARR